tara:strand:- start:8210 stop:9880 length:1671 start_codon:yes stop_codon:yes gene_type:complete
MPKIVNFLIVFLLYQSVTFSKINTNQDFNHKYLSSYFSGIFSLNKQNSEESLKFLEKSKLIQDKHQNYLRNYLISLIINKKVDVALNKAKQQKNKNNFFFEKELLLSVESIKKKDFRDARLHLNKLLESAELNKAYNIILFETLNNYINVFNAKDIKVYKNNKFGEIDNINYAFMNCYLNNNKTEQLFTNYINSDSKNSRYIYFYIDHLIEKKKNQEALNILKNINQLDSTLLLSQVRFWAMNSNYDKINNLFSCKNEKDLIAEFFYLISNLYSSQGYFINSNFYLILANYLNPDFYFNSTLLVENYLDDQKYNLAKKELENISNEDLIYEWFKIKKKASIIQIQKNKKEALDYIKKKFLKLKKPNNKIRFEMANILRNFEDYDEAINIYTKLIKSNNFNKNEYADLLYKRGTCYERKKNYLNADKDFLESLNTFPNEPYVLNYLGYSWLERSHKINQAMELLKKAYNLRKDDPYITDSIGWAHFLLEDFISAEKYLQKAVMLMPYDPIVNDHYGDVLWKLEKKIQARYFWSSVLNLENTDDEMKKSVKKKIEFGL